MGTSLWPPLKIRKKCMFGKDMKPDMMREQFFSGWVTVSGDSSATSNWTYAPQYNEVDIVWSDDD